MMNMLQIIFIAFLWGIVFVVSYFVFGLLLDVREEYLFCRRVKRMNYIYNEMREASLRSLIAVRDEAQSEINAYVHSCALGEINPGMIVNKYNLIMSRAIRRLSK